MENSAYLEGIVVMIDDKGAKFVKYIDFDGDIKLMEQYIDKGFAVVSTGEWTRLESAIWESRNKVGNIVRPPVVANK